MKPGDPKSSGTPLVLVDVEELRALIGRLDVTDPRQRDHLIARWLKYVQWWDHRAAWAKRWHHTLRALTIVGGAALPALVSFRELYGLTPRGSTLAAAAVLVSLIVAICAGLESGFGFGDIWRDKREAAELLKSEGFSFMALVGEYAQFKTHDEAFPTFGRNVEALICKEIRAYVHIGAAAGASNPTAPQPVPGAATPT